jgi:hypothetical protein
VTKFIHFLTRKCIGGSAGYKVTYNIPGKDSEQEDFAPIVVHLNDSAMVESLRQIIRLESQTAEMKRHKNLTPQDLITVAFTEQRFLPLLEEDYITSS